MEGLYFKGREDATFAPDEVLKKAGAFDVKVKKNGYEPAEYADLLKEYCNIDYLRVSKDDKVEQTIALFDNRIYYVLLTVYRHSAIAVAMDHRPGETIYHFQDQVLNELSANKQIWKEAVPKKIGGIILWEIREHASDKESLNKLSDFYFKSNKACREYQDILYVLGKKSDNIDKVGDVLDQLAKIFKGYHHIDTPLKKKNEYYKKVAAILEKIDSSTLLLVTESIDYNLAMSVFRFLYFNDIPNKKDAL